MRARAKRLVLLVAAPTLLVLTIASMLAPTAYGQEYVDLDPELERRAVSLYDGLMCPQCNGQTISQSHAPIAATMRLMVREQLLADKTDAEIYAAMVDAFGESVLASPPKRGATLAVWVIPPLGLLAGAGLLFVFIRRLRAAARTSEESDGHGQSRELARSPEMERYLALVDSELSGDVARGAPGARGDVQAPVERPGGTLS